MSQQQPASARLDDTFLPAAYTICLVASPKRRGFSGTVQIVGKITAPATSIRLHSRGLKLSKATFTQGGGPAQTAKCTHIAADEMACLTVAKPLKKGPVALSIAFAGTLSTSMHGLYLAEDGPERALVTQCEASDARAIFPCFDEPAFKATFAWEVLTDKGLTVLTNGPSKGVTTLGNKQRHRFFATKKMSTYLAAVTIGHLCGGAQAKVNGIPCRIWAGKGKEDQTHFALEITSKVLPWYKKYFGTPYAYTKLDQVAVPGFDAGAMENVGAVFYRQSLLLMRQGQTSWAAQKRIAEVVAHEIAHQWFGNLVTMQWWDDLWLNEAFATFMAYTVCHAIDPSWRIWEDFLEGKEAALAADAVPSTHPIYAEVKSPAQATELFDAITYEKGCGVLRMAEAYLGSEVFARGIRAYIRAHRFGNAQGADLWHALQNASNKPVDKLMHSWIHQPGFPLITAKLAKPVKGRPALTLTQERFVASPTNEQQKTAAHQTRWLVPLVIAYDVGQGLAHHHVLLSEGSQTVALPAPAGAKLRWAYPNNDATGFFRTQLDAPLLAAVRRHGLSQLSCATRTSIIYENWALVRAGKASICTVLDLLNDWGTNETDPVVLRSIAGRLRALRSSVLADADNTRFSLWVTHLGGPHLERLGFDARPDESQPQRALRAALFDQLGNTARDKHLLARAQKMALWEQKDPSQIDANLAGTVLALSAVAGDKRRVGQVAKEYLRRKHEGMSPDLQNRYLGALCSFETQPAVHAALALTRDGTIPQEQLRVVLGSYLGRRSTSTWAWAFVKKHWKELRPQVGGMSIARLVEATGALPHSQRSDVLSFFAKNPVPEAERAVRKAIEAMDLAHAFKKRESKTLSSWLATWAKEQKEE